MLKTDASTKSIGYILYQSRPNEPDGIVACGRRSLKGPEFNYTVTELDMLSIVDALNKYRHFLLGRCFIIKSDHISLRFITPGSAHKQTNSSWCAEIIANMTGVSRGH